MVIYRTPHMRGTLTTVDPRTERASLRDEQGQERDFSRSDLVRWHDWHDLAPGANVSFDPKRRRTQAVAINIEISNGFHHKS